MRRTDDDSLLLLAELAEHAQLIIFCLVAWKKWVHENVSFRSVYDGQLQLCMYLLCDNILMNRYVERQKAQESYRSLMHPFPCSRFTGRQKYPGQYTSFKYVLAIPKLMRGLGTNVKKCPN
jgi:hypothetical protein